MAGSYVEVDPAKLEAAGSSMNDTYNEITKLIGEMEQLIVTDLRADWHGDVNHRRFRDSFKRGLETLRTNQQAASDFIGCLDQAAALYRQCEGEMDEVLQQGNFAGK